jgi:hypothetical protein
MNLFDSLSIRGSALLAQRERSEVIANVTLHRKCGRTDLGTKECQIRGQPACNCSLWDRRFVLDLSAVRPSLSMI